MLQSRKRRLSNDADGQNDPTILVVGTGVNGDAT
jgi:hypothetical protein